MNKNILLKIGGIACTIIGAGVTIMQGYIDTQNTNKMVKKEVERQLKQLNSED